MPHRRSALVVVSVAMAALVIAVALGHWPDPRPVGLADYLGWHDDQTPERAAVEAAVVQRRIADCMAMAGLTYREYVEPPPDIPDADLDPRAWAATWGFGVSTSVGVAYVMPPATDPNLAYIDSLAPDQREAYRAALFGSDGRRGCNGEANSAVYGRHDRLLAGLATDLAGLEHRIAADPRIVAAETSWTGCMSSASFRPSSRGGSSQEVIDLLTRRLEAIMGPPPGDPGFDRAALASLQAFEIKLAVRAIDCDERVRAVTEAVRLEHEARFVEDHRAVLDDIKAQAARLDIELGLASGESPDPVSFEP